MAGSSCSSGGSREPLPSRVRLLLMAVVLNRASSDSWPGRDFGMNGVPVLEARRARLSGDSRGAGC